MKKSIIVIVFAALAAVLLTFSLSFAGDSGDEEKIKKHLEKGNEYAAAGNLDKAMTEFKKVLKIDPANPLAHNNMGIIYKRNGLYVTAIDEFKQALEGMPNYYKTYNNLGNIYYEREYYDEAEKYYLKCLKVKPDFAECYWNLALCYEAAGEDDKAIRRFEKFKDLSNDPAYIGLAQQHIDDLENKPPDEDIE
jgi:Tfp pilus assembly protein PilF